MAVSLTCAFALGLSLDKLYIHIYVICNRLSNFKCFWQDIFARIEGYWHVLVNHILKHGELRRHLLLEDKRRIQCTGNTMNKILQAWSPLSHMQMFSVFMCRERLSSDEQKLPRLLAIWGSTTKNVKIEHY